MYSLSKWKSALENEVLNFDKQTIRQNATPRFCTWFSKTQLTEEVLVFPSIVFLVSCFNILFFCESAKVIISWFSVNLSKTVDYRLLASIETEVLFRSASPFFPFSVVLFLFLSFIVFFSFFLSVFHSFFCCPSFCPLVSTSKSNCDLHPVLSYFSSPPLFALSFFLSTLLSFFLSFFFYGQLAPFYSPSHSTWYSF